jgi:hypothetical protein
MRLNKNIKIFFNYFLGPVLFIWLSFSIYTQIKHQPNLGQSWLKIRDTINSPAGVNLLFVGLLMIVNWSIEACKWMMAVRRIQPVDFFTAFKAVLSGVSFAVSTPNRTGEYLGRILYMKEGKRLRAISITIVSSMSQLIITLLMGSIGLMLLMEKLEAADLASVLWIRVVLVIVLITVLILTLLYFRLSWLVRWLDRLPGARKYSYFINALEEFNATLLWSLLSLSAARFFVFIIQYFLLFRLFGVELSLWEGFLSMSVVFLIMAILPTIALVELGLRGEVSLKVLQLFSANGLGIGLTTATVWLINLVIPAIIGSLLILSVKIFKKQNEKI